jgi:peptidoglycan hydrolase-like protein with peptidoglycan-binding domain
MPTSAHATRKRTSSRAGRNSRSKKVTTRRGQQVIDSARAREIQAALIRQNYMNGEPSGMWDSATQDAMRRYQVAHGWQSKTIPDSRALIGLGLGPSSDHLLNPESAMTAAPAASDPKAASKAAENNIPQQ